MKKLYIALVVIAIGLLMGLFSSCNKIDLPEGVPICVEELARELRNAPVADPPATIEQYRWNDALYYYIPGGCCDILSNLYDSNCNLICAPDGGFTGAGDGQCPEFRTEAEKIAVIWKDDRN